MKIFLVALMSFLISMTSRSYASSAEPSAQIQAIETYLNSIRTLTADFTQMNQDGSIFRGKLYLERPQNLRLRYTVPPHLTIVTKDGYLIQHDKDAGDPISIPLASTPAGVILGKKVRLSGDVTVTSLLPQHNGVSITVVRTQEPENGSISFLFRLSPSMQLERWIVYDAQGSITEVALSNIRQNEPINSNVFKVGTARGY